MDLSTTTHLFIMVTLLGLPGFTWKHMATRKNRSTSIEYQAAPSSPIKLQSFSASRGGFVCEIRSGFVNTRHLFIKVTLLGLVGNIWLLRIERINERNLDKSLY